MSQELTTITPGYLVNLRTVIKGGVEYETTQEGVMRDGRTEEKAWRTLRRVEDVPELEAAVESRNKAGNMIRAKCIPTPFGLLCPESRIDELRETITKSRAVANEHNRKAKHTQIDVYVLMGKIAATDNEAARAILSDIRDARDEMMKGIKGADVAAVRKAALRAKQLAKMLTPKQGDMISATITAAREAAKEIVKRVEKQSEKLEKVILELDLKPISELRFVNIDSDNPEAIPKIKLSAETAGRFAAVSKESK